LLSIICLLLTAIAAIAAWPTVRPILQGAAAAASGADPTLLLLAALLFVSSPVCCGLLWRRAILRAGGGLTPLDACARYGTGSLVNTVLPAHAGDVVRSALLLRALPSGGRLRILRCFVVVQLARLSVLAAFVAASALHLELAAAAVLTAAVGLLLVVSDTGRLIGLALLGLGAKVGAVALVLGTLGISAPLQASMAVVPAFELAAMLPLTPGNIGVASAAAGLALHAQGVPASAALSASVVLHGVETAAGLAYGAVSVLYLLLRTLRQHRMGSRVDLRPLRPDFAVRTPG
jgi:uncharacterized membrane protein YbhN (UPF0104 family)